MAVSPTADISVRAPAQDPFTTQDESVRLTDCQIAIAPRPNQLAVNFENPLCRLAARTVAGAGICGHGCGVCGNSGQRHTCHLGLTMERVGSANRGGAQQWVGRRFLSVRAMHKALDALLAAGFGEDEILNYLPPNPIVNEEDLREAAHELIAREESGPGCRRGAEALRPSAGESMPTASRQPIMQPAESSVEEKPVLAAKAADHGVPVQQSPTKTPKSVMSPPVRWSEELIGTETDQTVGNVLEYVAQVHSLLKTAVSRESACERFLRALCATVPFDEMSIFLQSKEANEPVIIAAVEKKKTVDIKLQKQATRLDSQPLGQTAFQNMEALVEVEGTRSPLDRDFEGPGKIAIPLLSTMQPCQGVWLASRSGRGNRGLLGSQWVRLVQLLGKLLSGRLEEIENQARLKSATAKTPALTEPTGHVSDGPWPSHRWLDELQRELARGARMDTPLALLYVRVEAPEGQDGLPMGQFTRAMRRDLRAYDQVAGLESAPNSWLILMPQIDATGAQMAAGRLVSFFEDLLDAEGGMEERGLKLGIGIAIGCSGEADARQFIDQAAQAARLAVSLDTGSPIKLLEFPQRTFGA